jgi:hypothetical protein
MKKETTKMPVNLSCILPAIRPKNAADWDETRSRMREVNSGMYFSFWYILVHCKGLNNFIYISLVPR